MSEDKWQYEVQALVLFLNDAHRRGEKAEFKKNIEMLEQMVSIWKLEDG